MLTTLLQGGAMKAIAAVFLHFFKLGCYAFGGPTAHIGYFRLVFVEKYRWLNERQYGNIVAFCQVMPGPASSQAGMVIGYQRAGVYGALTAFLGFTLPSVMLMLLLAMGYDEWADTALIDSIMQGIKLVVVAVVADTVLKMGKSFCPDPQRRVLALLCTVLMLLKPHFVTQLTIILLGAVYGSFCQTAANTEQPQQQVRSRRSTTTIAALLLISGLLVLPIAAHYVDARPITLMDSFFRTGSVVFGGGHVVLPMLQTETVNPSGVSASVFLAGYSVAQAVPGPMFTLATFIGGMYGGGFSTVNALIATTAIFAPSLLIVLTAWPYWQQLSTLPKVRAALLGINAAVVGLLLSALWNPVIDQGINSATDIVLAFVAYWLLAFKEVPIAVLVIMFALAGIIL